MANDSLDAKQIEVLDDLVKEKSIWQIYAATSKLKSTRPCWVCALLTGLLVFSLSLFAKDVIVVFDQFLHVSNLAFGAAVSLMGFLIAGFSFFATVADKSLFCRMAEALDKKSGLSVLKSNLFTFIRVLILYLGFTIASFLLATLLAPNSASRITFQGWLMLTSSKCACGPVLIASTFLGIYCGTFVLLLMELTSFVFNVYHVVVSGIHWELNNEYLSRSVEGDGKINGEGNEPVQ